MVLQRHALESPRLRNTNEAIPLHARRRPSWAWLLRCVAWTRAFHLDEFVAVDELDAARRGELGPTLHEIFCASYGELDREVVLPEIVFKAGGYLGLYRDRARGRIVGFSAIKPERITVGGRTCVSLQASAYFYPGEHGGPAAGRLGLAFALVHKLRRPLTPLVYAFEMLSPVSYRRGTRIFAQIYPHRQLDTPPEIAAIADAVIRRRGLLRVTGRPDLVRYDDPASHARVVPRQLVERDPDVAFYLSRNPDYRRGHILFAIAPVTLFNLAASSSMALTRLVRALTPRRR